MPRHSRIKSKTNIYHVMSRGLNKQLLFDDETDYLRYLQLLNDIKKEYGIKVYAYCLMSNHVHIILKDDNEMLSTAMRRLNSRYAMYYIIKCVQIVKKIMRSVPIIPHYSTN